MAVMVPPRIAPQHTLGDGDGLRRVHFHLRLVGLTTVTVLATAWICTYGMFPAILALVTAKHVLVAILALGLGMGPKEDCPRSRL